jgi:hypothetical protein
MVAISVRIGVTHVQPPSKDDKFYDELEQLSDRIVKTDKQLNALPYRKSERAKK